MSIYGLNNTPAPHSYKLVYPCSKLRSSIGRFQISEYLLKNEINVVVIFLDK